MKRFKITLKSGGEEIVRVVQAQSKREALRHPRAAGTVLEAQEVIPNVALRAGLGYYLQAQIGGKRYYESLHTQSREEAVTRAKVKLDAIEAGRWTDLERTRTKKTYCTVGQLLAEYERAVRRRGRPELVTAEAHQRALLRLLRETARTEAPEALRCDVINADLAKRYGEIRLAGPWDGMAEEASARRTVYSTLTHARAPLARDWCAEYAEAGLHVPVDSFREFRERFVTDNPAVQWERPDPEVVAAVETAAAGLEGKQPGLWAVWLLSRFLGLRAKEQAFLRWTWFRELPDGGAVCEVRRREDEDFKAKTKTAKKIPVHPSVWARLLNLRQDGPFVLPGATVGLRYAVVTREFSTWMKAQGWTRRMAAHELRKLFGDDVAEQYGDRASDVWLGHAAQTVGDRHYRSREAAGAGLAIGKV